MTPKKTRHRDLAELSALLTIRSRPIGIAEHGCGSASYGPKTNWAIVPANDNLDQTEASQLGIEQAVEITPSIDKIMNEVSGDDIDFGHHVDEDGKSHRVIVRWGRLRFSNGAQTERATKLSFGEVVDTAIKMPVGAMLGARERSSRDKGSVPDQQDILSSRDYFAGEKTEDRPAGLFSAQFSKAVAKAPRTRRTGPQTKAEARQWLEDAIANTPNMPPVKKCPDGFPAGPANLAHLFPGLVKVATGSSGSQAWEGMASELEERQDWHATLQAMKNEDVELLTKAVSAKSLAELGEIRGYSGKYAIAAGRRLLRVANDNFVEARKLALSASAV